MRYVELKAPEAAAVSLEEVLAHSRILGHDEDEYLAGLIEKATRTLQRELSRQFITAEFTLYLDEFPDDEEIQLERLPIQSIDEVRYTDANGDVQTLDTDQYQADVVSPDIPARLSPAYACMWPETRDDTYNAVEIDLTAGYGDDASFVPSSIRHALCMIVAHWYENREPVSFGVVVTPIDFALRWLLGSEDWGCYA